MSFNKPKNQPNNPEFSSGPCVKHPNWSLDNLSGFQQGRSHRSKSQLSKLQEVISLSHSILGMPDEYKLAIVPGSDTGAFEMALWNLLGSRGVDVAAWEVFGKIWIVDIVSQLRISDVRVFEADFGCLPNMNDIDTDRDVVFTWNGTTSGVTVPNGDWIKDSREGLTICDATSAVFAMDIPWEKLDVVTWSWQKCLGSEAGHGMIALSPRAVKRLESYRPQWPIPKVFSLTKNGKFMEGAFIGKTINTPSMLAVEDCLSALKWVENNNGLAGMIKRSANNLIAVENWVEQTNWADFLPETKDIRSSTSICLKIIDPWFVALENNKQWEIVKEIQALLENEGVGYDFANHRESVPGFRIWGGGMTEQKNIECFLEWLDWGYSVTRSQHKQEAA